jgi:hypothetical protein
MNILERIIRPLVWIENPDTSEGGWLGGSDANIGPTYHVMDDGWCYHRSMFWRDASDLAAAQAAAEADYRERIAAALEVDKIVALVEAGERALAYIEGDEAAHGRNFGEGNVLRAALAAFRGTPDPHLDLSLRIREAAKGCLTGEGEGG